MNTDDPKIAPDESVNSLQERLAADPANHELKTDLVWALWDRYLWGSDELDANDDSDLDLIRTLLEDLPHPKAPLPRSYVAYVDKRDDESIEYLVQYLSDLLDDGQPISSDEFYNDFLYPFEDAAASFWAAFLSRVEKLLAGTATVDVLKGLAVPDDNVDLAVSFFVAALEKDPSHWLAAQIVASIYQDESNWESAANYYAQALQSPSAEEFPNLHFDIAWCLGKLKRLKEEEIHLRRCLDLDPDFPYALNNLGWSLYKQGNYEAALNIFDDAIQRGNDGKYPLRNRARTLSKLGRFEDAIAAWKAVEERGKPLSYVRREIEELRKKLNKETLEPQTVEEELVDETEIEVLAEASPGEVQQKTESAKDIRRHLASTEQLLESMVEQLIDQGSEVFGRKLRMYQAANGLRGRQYVIPGHGRIDLLTEDIENNDLVVIELKKDESHENVVGQIAMYMAWVRENLAEDNQKVVGIICVFAASTKLALAARSVAGLSVFEYDLGFRPV